MEQSPRLSLSYLAPSQAQKHVTVNETFRRLDQLVQSTVLSRTVSAEPGAPSDGDAYILPAGASGAAWEGFAEGNIAACQDGAWVEIAAREGLRVWVADEDRLIACDGAAWAGIAGESGESAEKFGVNATADATNRLAVKSDAVLFSHDDVTPGNDDCQVKINKAAAGDTASLLFQTGYSGRAEFGLAGDDNFHIKVSPDGSGWTEAIWIDRDNGDIGLGTGAPGKKLHILSPDNNDGFILETTNTASGRVGFDLKTAQTANAGDFFRFNFRGDIPDVVLTAWDASAAAWTGWLTFRYVGGETDIGGSVMVGNPTGGHKGAGAINAQAVYDDNALLTCYVFDQALDGAVDAGKWDAKVPDRRIVARNPETGEVTRDETEVRTHEPLRKFTARIGGSHDPLTLDGYARHWKEKRHLTSMPNEAAFDPEKGMAAGAWIQRLVETVEIQAVLIEQLNQRVKAQEASGVVTRV